MRPGYVPGPGDGSAADAPPAVADDRAADAEARMTPDRRVAAARRSDDEVLLEGVHALKHAVRFGAHLEVVLTPDPAELARLLAELAPDVRLPVAPRSVDAATWGRLAPRELPSPVLAVARRPAIDVDALLSPGGGHVVALEQPRHLGNLGAAIRVAAAADAAGVLVLGDADPWHPTAVRAAAGLQFALPVARVTTLPTTVRPLVAIDPAGPDLGEVAVPADALLAFGTERAGLTPGLRRRATHRLAIPMRPGVSSLNLATAVGIVLYTAR